MSKRKKKPLKELKAMARLALDSPALVEIASSANSPTAASERARGPAYELAYLETGDVEHALKRAEKLALACYYLACIKRDYGKPAFYSFVSSVVSQHPRHIGTGKSKGEQKMEPKGKITTETSGTQAKESGKAPSLPLTHIGYIAALNGAFARVRCKQEYKNDADHPVEAVYVFPLPDDSSVTACVMQIGRRKVKAELKKREEARKEYDKAVAAGHHGALMEQERPNIFTMNVGGVEPGEKISVRVDYVQRVPWQAGGGRFRIPLVVAPRFIPGQPTGKQAGGWSPDTDEVPDASRITPPVAREGVSYNADISISFSPGFRCKLTCPSHPDIIAEQTVAKADTVELKTGDIRTDRDFTLVYASVSKVSEVAVHAGEFKGENFLLASILPPGDAAPVGSDIVLVLDCSGSMDGPKIAGLKEVAKRVLEDLKVQKVGYRVGILPFNDVDLPVHGVSEINEVTEKFIDELHASGGTELGPALTKAEGILPDSSRPRTILLITDGQTESGVNWSGKGVRLIAVGIDTAVNDALLKDLARRNNGTCEWVYPGEDYGAVSGRLVGYLSGPVLREVNVQTSGEVVGVSDVFKGRPATIAARFASGMTPQLRISGKDPEGKECSWEVSAKGAKECDFAGQIWAREFLRECPEAEKQIEASLKFGIICQQTAFVAISEKEVPGQKPERVEILVNSPASWNYDAVFGQPRQAQLCCGLVSLGQHHLLYDAPDETHMYAFDGDIGMSEEMGFMGDLGNEDTGLQDEEIEAQLEVAPSTPMPSIIGQPDSVPRRLIDILVASEAGRHEKVQNVFRQLNLTVAQIKALADEERAMAYYFALRLRSYGLHLKKEVMQALAVAPAKSDAPAQAWYNLALKELGRPFVAVLPAGCTGADYLAWKFGSGPQPSQGPWVLIP